MPLISTLEMLRPKSFKQTYYSVRHTLKLCVFFVILRIQVICNESHIKKETILLLPFQAQESAHSPKKEPYTSVR